MHPGTGVGRGVGVGVDEEDADADDEADEEADEAEAPAAAAAPAAALAAEEDGVEETEGEDDDAAAAADAAEDADADPPDAAAAAEDDDADEAEEDVADAKLPYAKTQSASKSTHVIVNFFILYINFYNEASSPSYESAMLFLKLLLIIYFAYNTIKISLNLDVFILQLFVKKARPVLLSVLLTQTIIYAIINIVSLTSS